MSVKNFCGVFRAAHIPEKPGMWGPATVEPKFEGLDNLGVYHYGVWVRCARCGEDFRVARFHSARPIEFDGRLAKLYSGA